MALTITVIGNDTGDVVSTLRAGGQEARQAPLAELSNLARAGAKQPDVVILDLRGDSTIPPSLTELRRQHATTGVVIVASSLDGDFIRAAMRAGANECVAEPLTAEELNEALTQVARLRSPRAASQAFAVIGAKGGVGSTCLAVNMATVLAKATTSSTLLVDLHVSRGDAALYLGVEPRFSVLDALTNLQKLDDAFLRGLLTRGPSRLELLAAPEGGSTSRLDARQLRALLDFFLKQFEFTVVDVPRTEPGALEALEPMTNIIVATTQELPSVRSAAALTATLKQRYGKDKVSVVLTRHDPQAEIGQADIEKAIGAPVVHVFPEDAKAATLSLNKGKPVVLEGQGSLATSFAKFANAMAGVRLEKRRGDAKDGDRSSGWFGRLIGRPVKAP